MSAWQVSSITVHRGGFQVYVKTPAGSVNYDTGERYAALIEAAPEMLVALQEIVEEWGFPNTPKWHRARAAIAKAEGHP